MKKPAVAIVGMTLLAVACGSDDDTDDRSVTGVVVLAEDVSFSDVENAVLTVQLVDISLADAAATVLDTDEVDVDETSFPLTFDLDADEIVESNSYAVEARISADDTLLAINDTVVPVLTGGAPGEGVEVEVIAVAIDEG